MILSVKGIVFHTIKYSETSVIARVFTRELGLLSFIIPGVRSKSGRIKASHLMPLNLLELVISYRPQSGLQKVRELRCQPILSHLHAEMTKTGIAMFMKEILNHTIQEEEKNESLYDFLSGTIQILDLTESSLANYPNYFLIQLSKHLGFYPDTRTYREGFCFDREEGQFIHPDRHHRLCSEATTSALIHHMTAGNYEEVAAKQFASRIRKEALSDLLDYYRIHLHHFKELRSPAILGEILSA